MTRAKSKPTPPKAPAKPKGEEPALNEHGEPAGGPYPEGHPDHR